MVHMKLSHLHTQDGSVEFIPTQQFMRKYFAKKVRVMWIGEFGYDKTEIRELLDETETRVMRCPLKDWDRFAKSIYLPRYDGGTWYSARATPLTLHEYCKKGSVMKNRTYNHLITEKQPVQIVIAHSDPFDVGVIIDGVHRACSIELMKPDKRPKVEVIQIHGQLIHLLFPFDFSLILLRRSGRILSGVDGR